MGNVKLMLGGYKGNQIKSITENVMKILIISKINFALNVFIRIGIC